MVSVGDVVKIYEKPLTREDLEGDAKVVGIATPPPKDCWLDGKPAKEYHLWVILLDYPEDGKLFRRYFEFVKA